MTPVPVLEVPSEPSGPDVPIDPPLEAPGDPGVEGPVETPGPEPAPGSPDPVPEDPEGPLL
jgi:hypothetical protein